MNKFVWKSKRNGMTQNFSALRRLRSFGKSDSGSMTILTIFLILVIFTAAGFAVDVMRFDRERARLQYALDRAVLAAADLDQDLCPKDVVVDYLSKEGLDQYLVGDPIVTPDVCGSQAVVLQGYRRVEAQANIDVEMHFMKWRGVDTIASAAASVAEESIGDVEISLVLDVSGSMAGTKLANLQKAATDFVDEMTTKSEDGKLSISIVPYSEQVSVPDILMSRLNTTGRNDYANCIDFAASDFSTTAFNYHSGGPSIPQTLYFTDSGNYDRRPSGGIVNDQRICLSNNHNIGNGNNSGQREMTILQKDATVLKQRINAMEAYGWTSIDVGLKWGLALLDETMQPLISNITATGAIPNEFSDRPAPNGTADTLKVVVLMTDGENTRQHMVLPPYHENASGFYYSSTTSTYSLPNLPITDPSDPDFLWPTVDLYEYDSTRGFYWARERVQPDAYGAAPTYRQIRCSAGDSNGCTSYNYSYQRDKPVPNFDAAVPVVSVDWPSMWERTTKNYMYDLLDNAYGRTFANTWFNASSDELRKSDKDPRVRSLCADAEQERIVIFSIAFEAPDGVKPLLQDCATADGAYYEADGTQIIDVFASIGSSIQNLRLTQ
ncbi:MULTISPECIES: pilus assembly protein TadG-related protein [unclassified Ruegeria]|uniref:pilus assembly protein TadG-related protein n=1 Tax=unclassified Ruegeria TaxID=2625375 RepID=UPI001489FF03|nr:MULTISPECIES: pilus assembly protein TadG-related protein [unclassified Ruegeria]